MVLVRVHANPGMGLLLKDSACVVLLLNLAMEAAEVLAAIP